MKVLTISSLKGGVGKTTLGIFLARALAGRGHRVLGVDLDHNNNATDYWMRYNVAEAIESLSVLRVLTRQITLEAAITKTAMGFDFIPATPTLSRVGVELARDPGAALRLRAGLRKLDYDFVIIDTPPSLSLELTIGLYAADLVLVPLSASRWTLQGFQIIADEVARVEEAGLPAPGMLAVPSMVSESEEKALRETEGWTLSRASIYRDAAVRGAVDAGRGLREGTRATGWFEALAGEVVGC